jgi:hypothetical protein
MSVASDTTAFDLRASGPLEVLDGALLAVRSGGPAPLARAWAGSAPLALCALGIYYVERVEGIRSLRPPFAVLLVLAWWMRALALSRSARAYALSIRNTLPLPEPPPRGVDVLCTASVVGIGLWVWLWLLVFAAMMAPLAIAGVLPFVALRGAVAPSWLARAACARERGLAAFGQAFDDTAGMRGVFLIVEALTLLGAIGLFGNLYALLSLALLLGHALLGFEVAFVSSFLSPDNTLVLLLLATATLLVLEPLRAAISAQAFVDARSRRDGADLHAAVDAAIERSSQRGGSLMRSEPPSAALVLVLAGALLAPRLAHAAPAAPAATPDAAEESPAAAGEAQDERVREQLGRILAQPEFREFAEGGSSSVREWFDKLLRWLDQLGQDERKQHDDSSINLPPVPPWLVMSLALIALAIIGMYVARAQRAGADRDERAQAAADAPLEVTAPVSQLDEAARLAALGDARGALRALYLATLFALDRNRLIEYEPSRTNWQYLRSLPHGELRSAFAAFTRIFDHKWYGHEPATLDDYHACRQLADRICDTGPS